MENKNNDKKVINCKFSQFFLEFVALLLVWNDSNSVFLRQLKRNNLKQIRNMKKIRAAVVGYGNIGKFTLEALEAAPDFEVAGIVRRNGAENKPAELADYPVVKDIRELKDVDVAILATPLSDRIYKAAEDNGIPCMRLPSGAGHDAAVIGAAGIPVGMIFIANQNGSHNPHEEMIMKDFMTGTDLLWQTVRQFD